MISPADSAESADKISENLRNLRETKQLYSINLEYSAFVHISALKFQKVESHRSKDRQVFDIEPLAFNLFNCLDTGEKILFPS
jgi:arginine deiminase